MYCIVLGVALTEWRTLANCELRPTLRYLLKEKNKKLKMSKGSSNKVQKTDHEGGVGGGGSASTPLVKTLLKEKGIIRKIVEITSVSQTFRLLMTCKESLKFLAGKRKRQLGFTLVSRQR